MNIDFITRKEDIDKYPLFYFTELLHEKETSFTLLQYGPYLLMNHPEFLLKYEKKEFANPLFLLMRDVANILYVISLKETIAITKNKLLALIKENNSYKYKYSTEVNDILQEVIINIRDYQMNEKILESAILNYSPIVPYAGTISRNSIENTSGLDFNKEITRETLDEDIEYFLVDNIVEIMQNNDLFINTDDCSCASIIPYDVKHVWLKDSVAKYYFVMIYLRYNVSEERLPYIIDNISSIYNVWKSIRDGKPLDIYKATESLMNLSFNENEVIKDE